MTRPHAPGSQRFSRILEGKGRVFGVKFRPGGFYPFLRSPVSAITDAIVRGPAITKVDQIVALSSA